MCIHKRTRMHTQHIHTNPHSMRRSLHSCWRRQRLFPARPSHPSLQHAKSTTWTPRTDRTTLPRTWAEPSTLLLRQASNLDETSIKFRQASNLIKNWDKHQTSSMATKYSHSCGNLSTSTSSCPAFLEQAWPQWSCFLMYCSRVVELARALLYSCAISCFLHLLRDCYSLCIVLPSCPLVT